MPKNWTKAAFSFLQSRVGEHKARLLGSLPPQWASPSHHIAGQNKFGERAEKVSEEEDTM